MSGELPLLSLRISDDKLRRVLALLESIPLPENRSAARTNTSSSTKVSTSIAVGRNNKNVRICTFTYFFPPQPKQSFTPQLTPRRPLNLADQRSSIIFESCETISITSLGEIHTTFASVMLTGKHNHCTNFPVRVSATWQVECYISLYVGVVISGSEEDLFYDAPSSPVGDRPFFPDNPMPLRYADLHKKSLAKEDAQKNMTDFNMVFKIKEVNIDTVLLK